MSIAQRCYEIRQVLGLSARKLSAKLEVSNSVWTQCELGQLQPGFAVISGLRQMGISIDWLLSGEGTMYVNGVAPVLPQGGRTEAISELVKRLNQLLETPDGTSLYAWQELVRHIQELPNGATVEQLASKMYASYARQDLEKDLQVLVTEGILAEAKGTYRLIRAYVSQEHTAYELRVLNMVRILLKEHLPSIKVSPRGKSMVQADLFVERGQGVERLREVQRRLVSLVSSSDMTRRDEQQEHISILFSSVVNEHEDNPDVGR
ncbi:MAG: helix-turn-helix domain-containing protein [Myxococcota bacterium]